MAASMIPPPIVQSTYASPPSTVAESFVVEKFSPLDDRQSELGADLQFLLDAQAEALLRGLEGEPQDDSISNRSTTPTVQSVRSNGAAQIPSPMRRKPGLGSARKGLHRAMIALSEVKEDELQDVGFRLKGHDQTLEQIDEWEKKRVGLLEATKTIDSSEDTVRAQRLRQDADTLQEEINTVEFQLEDMKERHRKLIRQATAVENAVQAKLASYTSSLRLLDKNVQGFLSQQQANDHGQLSPRDGKTSVWQLPTQRRTLDMARQECSDDRAAVVQQRDSVSHEKTALDEGAALWKDVVAKISGFERRLRLEMIELSAERPDDLAPAENTTKLQNLVHDLDTLIVTLESKSELAKDRSWNLLIAAIGAELDALKKGKDLLGRVLSSTKPEDHDLGGTRDPITMASPNGDEIHQLDRSFETGRRRRPSNSTEDDDPDPELLFSTHEEEEG